MSQNQNRETFTTNWNLGIVIYTKAPSSGNQSNTHIRESILINSI